MLNFLYHCFLLILDLYLLRLSSYSCSDRAILTRRWLLDICVKHNVSWACLFQCQPLCHSTLTKFVLLFSCAYVVCAYLASDQCHFQLDLTHEVHIYYSYVLYRRSKVLLKLLCVHLLEFNECRVKFLFSLPHRLQL